MLLRSLALRDEAIALCDEAVVLMLLWKLAPINDISTFGSLVILLRSAVCTSCNSGHAHAVCCSLAAVSSPESPFAVARSSDAIYIYTTKTHPEFRAAA